MTDARMVTVDTPNGPNQVPFGQPPDTCPICGKGIEAIFKMAASTSSTSLELQAIFQCPRVACRSFFIAYYKYSDLRGRGNVFNLQRVSPIRPEQNTFPEVIESLSPNFVRIYNQANVADQAGLDQIRGPGYRKALEFLIKDFAISQNAEKEEDIKESFLGKCINNYINDPQVQKCAERAAWLGNDETHYCRFWEDKDVEDLKILIQLTVNWIHSVLLTKRYSSDMPSKKHPK